MNNLKRKNRVSRRFIASLSLALFSLLMVWGITVISQGQEKQNDEIKVGQDREDSKDPDKEEQRLIDILKNKKKSTEVIFKAIEVLGLIESEPAIPVLISYLDYEKFYPSRQPKYVEGVKPNQVDGFEIGKTIPLSGRYPAVGALFRIGGPALPLLVKVIENEEPNSVKSQNALYAIQQIFIENQLEAVLYLEKAMTESTAPEGSKRLNIAAEKVRKEWENLQQ